MSFFDCYQKAGKIASAVRENARKKNHVGSNLVEICDSIEREIREKGGAPAFPVNVSLNEIAAHYTAEPNDQTIVKEDDVLKIDIGVHIQGFIADTAVTVSYNHIYDALVKAAEAALSEAVRIAKANTKASDIGRLIENTITKMGFKPIQNLSGHSLEQYTIHAGKSIPNIWTIGSSFNLAPNQAYAIEPFVTMKDGHGAVYDGKIRNIFGLTSRKPTRENDADKLLEEIWNRYKTLPFALRWLQDKYDEKEVRKLVQILAKKRNVHSYPVLVEGNGKTVAQAEHTLIPIDSSSVEVITI